MLFLNHRNPIISATWKNMKTFLFIMIAFIFGVLLVEHRKTQDYSSFDSLIVKSQLIMDSASVQLESLKSFNDSLMDVKFGK